MQTNSQHPTPSEQTTNQLNLAKKPGTTLIVFTGIVLLLNIIISILLSGANFDISDGRQFGNFLGFVMGRFMIFPGIVVALFMIGKQFRNARAATIIYLCVNCFMLFFGLVGIIAAIA